MKEKAITDLEHGVYEALMTYSNVHRGSGHNSMVSTLLYEKAREIVLEHLGLNREKYVVIFCTARRAEILKTKLKQGSYQSVSSRDIGLPLGVTALAVIRKALPKGIPFQTGGGAARLISRNQIIWAAAPDKFEAGTPAIINIIAFARALQLTRKYEKTIFQDAEENQLTVNDILYNDEFKGLTGKKLLEEFLQTIIGRGLTVPTAEGLKPFINLDYGASTPAFKPMWDAAHKTWYATKQVQQDITREVRKIIADVLGAPSSTYDVIFTSNTTEAINLAAESLNREPEHACETVVLNTLLEHSSNELPWQMYPTSSKIRLTVDNEGFIDLKELDKVLSAYNKEGRFGNKRIKLVAVSGASNVLGTFNDLEEISRIVHSHGAQLLVDAAQMVAHRKVGIERCGIDYIAFSAHKVYAPFGTGVLVVRKGLLRFSPSELDLIQASGEENPGGIAALGKALLLLQRIGLDLICEQEQALTARALRGLSQIPGLTIYGIKDPATPGFSLKGGVIIFSLKGIMSDKLSLKLAEQGGIGTRFGCHCAHLLIKHIIRFNPRLERLQGLIITLFPKIRLPGLTRISLGIGNTEQDIDAFLQIMDKIARKPRDTVKPGIKRHMDDFVEAAAGRVYSVNN